MLRIVAFTLLGLVALALLPVLQAWLQRPSEDRRRAGLEVAREEHEEVHEEAQRLVSALDELGRSVGWKSGTPDGAAGTKLDGSEPTDAFAGGDREALLRRIIAAAREKGADAALSRLSDAELKALSEDLARRIKAAEARGDLDETRTLRAELLDVRVESVRRRQAEDR